MNRTRLYFTLLLVVLSASASVAAGGDTKTDLHALQGQWLVVSFIFNGEPRAADPFKGLRLQIKGDKYLVTQDGATASRTLRPGSAQHPQGIGITFAERPDHGQ